MDRQVKRPAPASPNHLTFKFGKWIEASATGPLAIGALVALAGGFAFLRAFGYL